MDIFEKSEVNFLTRTLQQDEEEEAVSSAGANIDAPICIWNSSACARFYPKGVKPKALVIATSPVACALVNEVSSEGLILGSLILPEVSMKGNMVANALSNRSCLITACGPAGETLTVSCQYSIPPERTKALCRKLMEEMHPEQVLILGSMQAEHYTGPEDASSQAHVLRLSTGLAAHAASPVPLLPTGNIVSGLPAALLEYCQMRHIKAEAAVVLEMVPSLRVQGVRPTARAVAEMIKLWEQNGAADFLGASFLAPKTITGAIDSINSLVGRETDSTVYT